MVIVWPVCSTKNWVSVHCCLLDRGLMHPKYQQVSSVTQYTFPVLYLELLIAMDYWPHYLQFLTASHKVGNISFQQGRFRGPFLPKRPWSDVYVWDVSYKEVSLGIWVIHLLSLKSILSCIKKGRVFPLLKGGDSVDGVFDRQAWRSVAGQGSLSLVLVLVQLNTAESFRK